MCGALEEDTEEGPTEEGGGGGAESEEGISADELPRRQSAEEGVMGPPWTLGGCTEEDWAQATLPPPVPFGDCLSRMFMLMMMMRVPEDSSSMHTLHCLYLQSPSAVFTEISVING